MRETHLRMPSQHEHGPHDNEDDDDVDENRDTGAQEDRPRLRRQGQAHAAEHRRPIMAQGHSTSLPQHRSRGHR
jgi:hypothetical protein